MMQSFSVDGDAVWRYQLILCASAGWLLQLAPIFVAVADLRIRRLLLLKAYAERCPRVISRVRDLLLIV